MSRRQRFQYAVRERSMRELKRSKETYCCLHICLVISLGLFFGLFFGITYPEYLLTNYVETNCKIVSTTTRPNYSCQKSCSSCSKAPNGSPSCSGQINHFQSLNPVLCLTDPNQCAQSGIQCNNGYKCCARLCSSCTSCSGTGTSRSCRTYECNCNCIRSTSRNLCTINCHQVYTAVIGFSFKLKDESDATGFYEHFFDTKVDEADEYLKTFPIDDWMICYYNPDNPNTVLIDGDFFTDWKIAILVIFGVIPLFICLLVYTKLFFEYCVSNMKIKYLWPITISIWVGFIVPLCILLPIKEVGYRINQTDMIISVIVLIIIGNVPFVIRLSLDYCGLVNISDLFKTDKEIPIANAIPIENEQDDLENIQDYDDIQKAVEIS
jgi:hypothetical protein